MFEILNVCLNNSWIKKEISMGIIKYVEPNNYAITPIRADEMQ